MAESLSMADEPVPVSPRKGHASETAEPVGEAAVTESGSRVTAASAGQVRNQNGIIMAKLPRD